MPATGLSRWLSLQTDASPRLGSQQQGRHGPRNGRRQDSNPRPSGLMFIHLCGRCDGHQRLMLCQTELVSQELCFCHCSSRFGSFPGPSTVYTNAGPKGSKKRWDYFTPASFLLALRRTLPTFRFALRLFDWWVLGHGVSLFFLALLPCSIRLPSRCLAYLDRSYFAMPAAELANTSSDFAFGWHYDSLITELFARVS